MAVLIGSAGLSTAQAQGLGGDVSGDSIRPNAGLGDGSEVSWFVEGVAEDDGNGDRGDPGVFAVSDDLGNDVASSHVGDVNPNVVAETPPAGRFDVEKGAPPSRP